MTDILKSDDGLRTVLISTPTGVSAYLFSEKGFHCLDLLITIDININKEIADRLQEFVSDFLENSWGTWSARNILDLIPLNAVYAFKIFNRKDKNLYFCLEDSNFVAYITEDYKKVIPKNIPIQRCLDMTLQDILYLDTGRKNILMFKSNSSEDDLRMKALVNMPTVGILNFQEGVLQKAENYNCWRTLTTDTISSILKFNDNGKTLAKAVLTNFSLCFYITDIAKDGTLFGICIRYICDEAGHKRIVSKKHNGLPLNEVLRQDIFDELDWIVI